MIKNIILFIFCVIGTTAVGQNLKTSVLVVGAGPAGFAAAIQSAKSGVKTLLIDGGNFESVSLSAIDKSVNAGIYADFLKRADSLEKKPATGSHIFTAEFTARVFKKWADTVKNLTLLSKTVIKKIKKTGKGWEVDLSDREIKAEVLVDASSNDAISRMVGLIAEKTVQGKPDIQNLYANNLYRTSMGVVKTNPGLNMFSLADFIIPEFENLILVNPAGKTPSLQSGQAAGTIAAYCGFFKTTTKNVDVRKIQSELLTFKARLISFDDVSESDSSMIAFQHIGLTGLLKGKIEGNKNLFFPNTTIGTDEIKQPFREYYSRSQIWFLDNKTDKLTIEDALSLIKFVGSRGEELKKQVEKAWNSSLKLTGKFDLKKPVTRKEFAVLLDTYLQPFGISVDLSGNVKK